MTRISFSAVVCALLLPTGTIGLATGVPVPTPPPAAIDFVHLPWTDGESLTYDISWTGLAAAQGTFVAHQKDGHWEFKLHLASAGMVDKAYPFTGTFWSILAPAHWRSVEYGEFRFEPSRTVKERTRIDYAKQLATRETWTDGKTKTFPIGENEVDDIGTMLYHIRAQVWKPNDHQTYHIYESNSEKEGLATCEARETRAFGIWPAQVVLRIVVLPGKGTHHHGKLTLWMTDDARHLPLHAELDFRYGTFAIDLSKATPPPAP